MAQRLKRLPAMQETWVGSLGREDPLEKETATHPSILAWRILWTEEPGGLQSMGSQSQIQLSDFTFFLSFFLLSVECKLHVMLPTKHHIIISHHKCIC